MRKGTGQRGRVRAIQVMADGRSGASQQRIVIGPVRIHRKPAMTTRNGDIRLTWLPSTRPGPALPLRKRLAYTENAEGPF